MQNALIEAVSFESNGMSTALCRAFALTPCSDVEKRIERFPFLKKPGFFKSSSVILFPEIAYSSPFVLINTELPIDLIDIPVDKVNSCGVNGQV